MIPQHPIAKSNKSFQIEPNLNTKHPLVFLVVLWESVSVFSVVSSPIVLLIGLEFKGERRLRSRNERLRLRTLYFDDPLELINLTSFLRYISGYIEVKMNDLDQ